MNRYFSAIAVQKLNVWFAIRRWLILPVERPGLQAEF